MQPYHTLKGSGSLLIIFFKVCGVPGCNPITLRRVHGHFYLVFLRFVECQDSPLSHFGGVVATITEFFKVR